MERALVHRHEGRTEKHYRGRVSMWGDREFYLHNGEASGSSCTFRGGVSVLENSR